MSKWERVISWPWAFTTTTSIAGIRPTSRGTPSASAPRWTSSARGKKSRASTACVSASVFTTLRRGPGASSCRCVTPATRQGPKKGVPYDALQTILDGKGKWWEGMDPVDLYGPIHTAKDPLHSPFANQFMWRVDDAITKYHPDVIYFDEHAGDSRWIWACTWGSVFSLRRWSRITTTSP